MAKLLSDKAYESIREVVRAERHRIQGGSAQAEPETPHQSPEVYIAKTPVGGITAREEAVLGSAVCDIFRVIGLPGEEEVVQVQGQEKRVYNLSSSPIPEETWTVVLRDKFGRWFVPFAGQSLTVKESDANPTLTPVHTISFHSDSFAVNETAPGVASISLIPLFIDLNACPFSASVSPLAPIEVTGTTDHVTVVSQEIELAADYQLFFTGMIAYRTLGQGRTGYSYKIVLKIDGVRVEEGAVWTITYADQSDVITYVWRVLVEEGTHDVELEILPESADTYLLATLDSRLIITGSLDDCEDNASKFPLSCWFKWDEESQLSLNTPNIFGDGIEPVIIEGGEGEETICRFQAAIGCGFVFVAGRIRLDLPALLGPGFKPWGACGWQLDIFDEMDPGDPDYPGPGPIFIDDGGKIRLRVGCGVHIVANAIAFDPATVAGTSLKKEGGCKLGVKQTKHREESLIVTGPPSIDLKGGVISFSFPQTKTTDEWNEDGLHIHRRKVALKPYTAKFDLCAVKCTDDKECDACPPGGTLKLLVDGTSGCDGEHDFIHDADSGSWLNLDFGNCATIPKAVVIDCSVNDDGQLVFVLYNEDDACILTFPPTNQRVVKLFVANDCVICGCNFKGASLVLRYDCDISDDKLCCGCWPTLEGFWATFLPTFEKLWFQPLPTFNRTWFAHNGNCWIFVMCQAVEGAGASYILTTENGCRAMSRDGSTNYLTYDSVADCEDCLGILPGGGEHGVVLDINCLPGDPCDDEPPVEPINGKCCACPSTKPGASILVRVFRVNEDGELENIFTGGFVAGETAMGPGFISQVDPQFFNCTEGKAFAVCGGDENGFEWKLGMLNEDDELDCLITFPLTKAPIALTYASLPCIGCGNQFQGLWIYLEYACPTKCIPCTSECVYLWSEHTMSWVLVTFCPEVPNPGDPCSICPDPPTWPGEFHGQDARFTCYPPLEE